MAVASGRLDALFFMAGMVAGTGLFAQVYEPIKGFYLAAAGPRGQTLTQLFGLPVWAVIGGLIIIAAGGFALGNWCERKFGGPLTAQELNETLNRGEAAIVDEIEIVTLRTN